MSPTEAVADKAGEAAEYLQVLTTGAGPTLGYIHGLIGNPGLHRFIELLGDDHQVVSPSLPGFNRSTPRPTAALIDWVYETSRTIDRAGISAAPVVAASVGAMLALEVAAIRPEAFERMVLLAPLGLWDPAEPVADLWSERTKHQPSMLLEHPERAEAFFVDDPSLGVEDLMESELQRYRTRTAGASLMWPIPEHGLSRRLERVTCPVHLVWGVADRVNPPAYAERFAELLPNCTGVEMIDGAGHLVEWDAPEATAAVVSGALA